VTAPLDPRAAQVRKILESRTFRDTEVLKRLFEYLAQRTLNHAGNGLKEYTVGVEAFGKPADYDPQIDSSVRVQTGKLRRKLEAYYLTEGCQDNLAVELPSRHFTLEFHSRQPASGAARLGKKPPRISFAAGGITLGLLALAAVLYLGRAHPTVAEARSSVARTPWTPEMQEFWGPFLDGSRPVLVALGTPLFVKVGTSTFVRDTTANDWDKLSKSEQIRTIQQTTRAASISPSFNYTPIGEAQSAVKLERLLLQHGYDLRVEASSDLTWEDISRHNMIFLGPPKYIPQTLDLPVPRDFEIMHHQVQNLHPSPGEPQFFGDKRSFDRTILEECHALISRFSGLHGSGQILVFAGSSTECTRAAVEFVTRPEYVESFVQQMHSRGGIPKWFQLVIHARFKDRTPIAIEPVTIHALN